MRENRIITTKKTAEILNMCFDTFKKRLPEMNAAGFPKFDTILKGYDERAIHAWLDTRAGLSDEKAFTAKAVTNSGGELTPSQELDAMLGLP